LGVLMSSPDRDEPAMALAANACAFNLKKPRVRPAFSDTRSRR
jgi:hypothetical protein